MLGNVGDLFFLPGNYVLSLLVTSVPQVAAFFGLSSDDYSGVLSGTLSAVLWLAAILLLGATYELVRRIDRAVTAWIRRLHGESMRSGRIAKRWLIARIHRLKQRARAARAETDAPEHVETHDLGELELAVLRSHAALEPGYMLTAGDLARSLGVRAAACRQSLHKLAALRLLDRSLGERDQDEGYVLSRLGRAFLTALDREPAGGEGLRRHDAARGNRGRPAPG